MIRTTLLPAALLLLAGCGGSDGGEAASSDAVQTAGAPAEKALSEKAAMQTAAASSADINMGAPQERPALNGAEIFQKQCSHCHAAGDDHPGAMQLGATRGPEYAVLAERTDLTADYVKYIVRHGLNAMPPFKPTAITDAELDRLAAYLAKTE